jgi:hypothetical protein
MRGTPGPRATFTDAICRSCPAQLTVTDTSHGMRRCKACRTAAPTGQGKARPVYAESWMVRPEQKAPVSWWINAPRNLTAIALAEVPRMRRGVAHFVDMDSMQPGSVATKSLRNTPL